MYTTNAVIRENLEITPGCMEWESGGDMTKVEEPRV